MSQHLNKTLTSWEAMCLFSLAFLYNMFNDVLSRLTVYAGSAAWMAQIFGALLSFLLLWMFILLYRRHAGKGLPEIFDLACGKFIGRLLGIVLFVYLILHISLSINHMIVVLQTYAYSGLTSLTIGLLVMAPAAIFAMYSIHGIARTISIFLPVILVAWLIVLVLGWGQYDPDLLNPIMGYGLETTVSAGLVFLSGFGGIVLVGVFGASFESVGSYKKVALRALIIASLMFTITALCYNMAVPYLSAADLPAGVLGIAQSTYYNRYMQKYEAVFIAVAISAITLLVAIAFVALKKTWSHLFAIKDEHSGIVIIPLALISICATRAIQTIGPVGNTSDFLTREVGGFICVGLILVPLIIGWIRNIGKKMRRRGTRLRTAIFTICLMAAILSGCGNASEPDSEIYPIILGYDRGENENYAITVKFMEPDMDKGGSGQSESGSMPPGMMAVEAPSLAEGMNLMGALMPKEISFLHVKMMVISEELAREGIEPFIGQTLRFNSIRPTMAVVVSAGSAHELIAAQASTLTDSVQMDMELLLEPRRTQTAFIMRNLAQVLYDYKSSYGDTMAVYGNVNRAWSNSRQSEGDTSSSEAGQPGSEEKNGNEETPEIFEHEDRADFDEGFLAGESPVMGGNGMELAGMAVFRGDRMVGTLNTAETQSLALIKGAFSRTPVVIPDIYKPDKYRVSLEVTQSRPTRYRTYLDEFGTTHISIEVLLNARVDFAQNPEPDYDNDPATRKYLEEHAERILEQRARRLIDRLQNELNSDVLQLGRRAARNFRTIQEWEAYNWREEFQNAQIDISFQISL